MRVRVPNRFTAFVKDYRLPLWSTVGLIVILAALLLLRSYERIVLAGVLGDSSSVTGDYAKLISKDSDVNLQKNEVDKEKAATETQQTSQSTSTSINSTGDSSAGNTTAAPAAASEPTTGAASQPPAAPFSAAISGFSFMGKSEPTPCDTTSGSEMCKTYYFKADVSTSNGPGTVSHKLRWNFGTLASEQTGSFTAPTGSGITQVPNQVKLRCAQSGNYTFQFFLTSPSAASSVTVPINHSCGTAPPSGT